MTIGSDDASVTVAMTVFFAASPASSTTTTACATCCIHRPTRETPWPITKRRKSRHSRRRARALGAAVGGPELAPGGPGPCAGPALGSSEPDTSMARVSPPRPEGVLHQPHVRRSEISSIMATEAGPVDAQTLAKRFERVKAKLRRLAEEAGLFGRE